MLLLGRAQPRAGEKPLHQQLVTATSSHAAMSLQAVVVPAALPASSCTQQAVAMGPCPRPPSAASSRGNACREPQALHAEGLRVRAAHSRRRRKWDKDQCRACITAPSGSVAGRWRPPAHPVGGETSGAQGTQQIAGFSGLNRLQKARGTRGDCRAGALLLWSQLSEPER